jgi:tryptophan-rich sensory protein
VPGPAWIPYSFAVIMVAVSLYCLGRLVAARLWDRQNHADVNVSHVLMGAAMAGMLVPSHNPFPAALGESVFGVLALWFLVRSIRAAGQRGIAWRDEDAGHHLSHYPIHMVMSVAMIYMYAVGTPTGSGGHGLAMVMGGAGQVQRGYVTLSLLFIVVLFASAVWQLDSIARFSPARMRLAYAASPSVQLPGPTASSHLSQEAQATVRLAEPSADAAPAAAVAQGPRRLLAPRLEIGCHVAMCIAMGYMLIVML